MSLILESVLERRRHFMPTFSLPDGDTLAYETHGDGEPLMLVTGTCLSMPHWPRPVIDALAADYRVIVYDHRGMGASSPSDQEVSVRSLAGDAAALLDHLEVGASHVLGWSLGSAVAQELALARPDLVASLVLYATWGRPDGFLRSLLAAVRSPWTHGDAATGVAALGVGYSPEGLENPELLAAIAAAQPFMPHTPEQIAMTARQWDADLAHDSLDRLPDITAPTTVLVGEQDVLTPPRLSRPVAERIPGARYVLVEGIGSSHGMMYERPAEWLDHVREHLRLASQHLPTAGPGHG
jgi:pimeloyl-ACP methyl ester carboxylesterase